MIIHKHSLGHIMNHLYSCGADPEFTEFDTVKLFNAIACVQVHSDQADNVHIPIQATKFIEMEDGTCYVTFTPYVSGVVKDIPELSLTDACSLVNYKHKIENIKNIVSEFFKDDDDLFDLDEWANRLSEELES